MENYFPNIFKDLIINNEKIIQKVPLPGTFPKLLLSNEEFLNLINLANLNVSGEEITSLIKLMSYVMRSNSMDIMLGKVSKEVSYKNYLREMEIIKKGVYKKNA